MFNICSDCLLIYDHSFASNSLNNSQDVRKTFSRSWCAPSFVSLARTQLWF